MDKTTFIVLKRLKKIIKVKIVPKTIKTNPCFKDFLSLKLFWDRSIFAHFFKETNEFQKTFVIIVTKFIAVIYSTPKEKAFLNPNKKISNEKNLENSSVDSYLKHEKKLNLILNFLNCQIIRHKL